MGLNFAFVLVLERAHLRRLDLSVADRLAPTSDAPGLAAPPKWLIDDGDFRLAVGESSRCLVFVDSTCMGAPLGCVSLHRLEGRRYALVWLRAATSAISRQFESDPEIRKHITAFAAEAGVEAIAFDREDERLCRVPWACAEPPQLPLEREFLPFWCWSAGSSQLAERRRQALDDRATILATRRADDSDEEVLEALLDADAFDADVDGYAARLIVALQG